jgi:hypothetical protein
MRCCSSAASGNLSNAAVRRPASDLTDALRDKIEISDDNGPGFPAAKNPSREIHTRPKESPITWGQPSQAIAEAYRAECGPSVQWAAGTSFIATTGERPSISRPLDGRSQPHWCRWQMAW